jgi:hypothetical protein
LKHTRFVRYSDVTAAGSRQLLEWCLARGGDAFTLSVVGAPGDVDLAAAALFGRLDSHRLDATTVKAIPPGNEGSFWTDPGDLWRLDADTVEILLSAFDHGILTYYPGDAAWCEDPVVYRAGELLLGIISHESEGVLRVTAQDEASLVSAAIPFHLEGEWVGY